MTDYDSVDGKLISATFGELRREREALMKRLVHYNDVSVRPRIRELTEQLLCTQRSYPR